MPTSQADVLLDLRELVEATRKDPEMLPNVSQEVEALEQTLGVIQAHKARQSELTALRQEATQLLAAAVVRGRLQAIQIRSVIRGKMDLKSERLVHFKVPPLRPRSRKRAVVKPPDGETAETMPGASASPSTKPVA